jgi:amino acid transporter
MSLRTSGTQAQGGLEVNFESEGVRRDVGFVGLLWSSEGSIIGSGWLLGAFGATAIAGPSALLAWILGGVVALVLALIHAELGGIFPVSGGTARFPHYSFGSLAGASFGWFAWLQAVSVAPIEVEAAIQYAAGNYGWAAGFVHTNNTLTASGIPVAIVMLGVFTLINFFGVRVLALVNSVVTWWKVIIPAVAIIYLAFHFHSGNFTASGGFWIKGSGGGLHAVLSALSGGGIVFSYLGFEQAVQLAGEARNPSRDVPLAVIVSILIGGAVYCLLDVVFVGSLNPSSLLQLHSWTQLGDSSFLKGNAFFHTLSNSPFVTIMKALGAAFLAKILLADAVISPSGTGLIYLTSTSRLSLALSKNGYVPQIFERTTSKYQVPVFSLVFAWLLGIVMFLPFPSWQKLVGFITSASVLMYAGAPLSLGALRLQKPELPRPFRLPGGQVVSAIGFILANYIIFWTGWEIDWQLGVAVLLGYAVMLVSGLSHSNPNAPKVDWQAIYWLAPYLIGMMVLSFLGSFGGGRNHLGFGWDFLVVGAFSVAIYLLALRFRLSSEEVDHYVAEVYPPPVGE